MAGLVTTLAPDTTISAAPYFAGPWRDFTHLSLPAGKQKSLIGDRVEMAVYVLSGAAAAAVAGERIELTEGSCVTIGLGSRIDVTATDSGIEMFVTTVNVDVADQ